MRGFRLRPTFPGDPSSAGLIPRLPRASPRAGTAEADFPGLARADPERRDLAQTPETFPPRSRTLGSRSHCPCGGGSAAQECRTPTVPEAKVAFALLLYRLSPPASLSLPAYAVGGRFPPGDPVASHRSLPAFFSCALCPRGDPPPVFPVVFASPFAKCPRASLPPVPGLRWDRADREEDSRRLQRRGTFSATCPASTAWGVSDVRASLTEHRRRLPMLSSSFPGAPEPGVSTWPAWTRRAPSSFWRCHPLPLPYRPLPRLRRWGCLWPTDCGTVSR